MNSEHNRFYVSPEHISRSYIIFPKATAHHVVHVLRKSKNDMVYIVDGEGRLYTTRILHAQGSAVKAEILKKEIIPKQNPPYIDLAFVPLKGNRNEFIVEKGKELGIGNFLLFMSQNGVVKDLSRQKIDRLTHIMISAMLQSQQNFISPIISVRDIQSLITRFDHYDRVFIADPAGTATVPRDGKSLLLVVGPEGGFARDELSKFVLAQAELLALGKRRLRSETAAIAGVVRLLVANHVL